MMKYFTDVIKFECICRRYDNHGIDNKYHAVDIKFHFHIDYRDTLIS